MAYGLVREKSTLLFASEQLPLPEMRRMQEESLTAAVEKAGRGGCPTGRLPEAFTGSRHVSVATSADEAAPPWHLLFVITSSDIGGAETVVRELASRLDRRQFDPVVCSLRPCGRVAEDIAHTGTRVLTLEMSEEPRPLELIAGAVKLARWLNRLGVDLIHSSLYRANILARLSAQLARRRPIVISAQHTLVASAGQRGRLIARWTRRLSDRIVAVSQAVRDELVWADHVPRARVLVIENGVDTEHFKIAEGDSARAHFGLRPDAVVVGGVGRLSPEKGFHHLLESTALMRRRGIPLDLLLVGAGPERTRLELEARALRLDGHLHFCGLSFDLRPIYAAMDVFALPSLQEGSPIALLEAMACERAIVATRVGGVPEIVEDQRSGLLVDPGSPATFADALMRLTGNPALRRRMGAEARCRVQQRFEVSRMVQRHAQLYRELLVKRQPV